MNKLIINIKTSGGVFTILGIMLISFIALLIASFLLVGFLSETGTPAHLTFLKIMKGMSNPGFFSFIMNQEYYTFKMICMVVLIGLGLGGDIIAIKKIWNNTIKEN